MGTAFDAAVTQKEEDLGVIPRAIQHTFRKIAECKAQAIEQGLLEPAFEVSVQFVELYNDDVLDLLSDDRSMSSSIRIHEDSRGEIVLHGVEQRSVFDMHGVSFYLNKNRHELIFSDNGYSQKWSSQSNSCSNKYE